MSAIYIPPTRNTENASIAFVGDIPGNSEIRLRRPLVGRAGNKLTDLINLAKIKNKDVYKTSVIKYGGQNKSGYYKKAFTDKGQLAVDSLNNELKKLPKLKVIIPLGEIALEAITGRSNITNWRGSILDWEEKPEIKVVPTIHPEKLLGYNGNSEWWKLIHFDLIRARRIMEGSFKYDKYTIKTAPTFREAINFLNWILNNKKQFAFDLETFGKKNRGKEVLHDYFVSCVSFSSRENGICEGISIPFITQKSGLWVSYYSIEQEVAIWNKIRELFLSGLDVIGQNLSYDIRFLYPIYKFLPTGKIRDSMIGMHSLFSRTFKLNLGVVGSIFTSIPFSKGEGKSFIKESLNAGPIKTFWTYNCLDSILCEIAVDKQEAILKQIGMYEIYRQQCDTVVPFVKAGSDGILVDLEKLYELKEEYLNEANKHRQKLIDCVGYDLNPNSPKQVLEYLKGLKGKQYKNKAGKYSADKDVLKKWAYSGNEAATHILKIREKEKLVSTYMKDAMHKDGRYLFSVNTIGTKFSRASSSSDPFNYGSNSQNWPHKLFSFIKPDPGYIGFAPDFSQAENRIVAYQAKDKNMKEAFEKGRDVHSHTGMGIASAYYGEPISYEEIIRQHLEHINAPLGAGNKPWRYYGKQGNHALNYNMGYITFSKNAELKIPVAKVVHEAYHETYKGVRRVFHKGIQNQVAQKGYVQNLLGRRYYIYTDYDKIKWEELYAFVPQSTVGDLINRYGVNGIYYDKNITSLVQIQNQVHDSLFFQINMDLGWKRIAEILIYIKEKMEVKLTSTFGEQFPLPLDYVICPRNYNKDEGAELKSKDFSHDADTLSEQLQQICKEVA